MEDRAAYGPSIDLPTSGQLPTFAQLAGIVQSSGDFAIAFRGGGAFGLRMIQSAVPLPRPFSVIPSATCIVAGGTKASFLS